MIWWVPKSHDWKPLELPHYLNDPSRSYLSYGSNKDFVIFI